MECLNGMKQHYGHKEKFLFVLREEKEKEKREKYGLACTLFFQSWLENPKIDAQSYNPASFFL